MARLPNAIFPLALVALVRSVPVFAQSIPPGTPATVVRRMEQVFWPGHLFDPAGHPEGARAGDPLGTAVAGMVVERRAEGADLLPEVTFYVGHVRPTCYDCPARSVAVAVRDTDEVTLRNSGDIDSLTSWLPHPIALGDSAAARSFLLQVLRASDLIGYRPEWFRPGASLDQAERMLARSEDGSGVVPSIPDAYSHTSPGQMEMAFAIRVPHDAIWVAEITQQHGGDYLHYTLRRVIRLDLTM